MLESVRGSPHRKLMMGNTKLLPLQLFRNKQIKQGPNCETSHRVDGIEEFQCTPFPIQTIEV